MTFTLPKYASFLKSQKCIMHCFFLSGSETETAQTSSECTQQQKALNLTFFKKSLRIKILWIIQSIIGIFPQKIMPKLRLIKNKVFTCPQSLVIYYESKMTMNQTWLRIWYIIYTSGLNILCQDLTVQQIENNIVSYIQLKRFTSNSIHFLNVFLMCF